MRILREHEIMKSQKNSQDESTNVLSQHINKQKETELRRWNGFFGRKGDGMIGMVYYSAFEMDDLAKGMWSEISSE